MSALKPKPGRPCKYPWRTMEVGDEFFAPGVTSKRLQDTARRYHRPKVFKCKKIMMRGVVGTKCMRIA